MRNVKAFGIGFALAAGIIGVIASSVWAIVTGYWPVAVVIVCSAVGLIEAYE